MTHHRYAYAFYASSVAWLVISTIWISSHFVAISVGNAKPGHALGISSANGHLELHVTDSNSTKDFADAPPGWDMDATTYGITSLDEGASVWQSVAGGGYRFGVASYPPGTIPSFSFGNRLQYTSAWVMYRTPWAATSAMSLFLFWRWQRASGCRPFSLPPHEM
jgi:hypothetical protein